MADAAPATVVWRITDDLAGSTNTVEPKGWPARRVDHKVVSEEEMRRRDRENILAALHRTDWRGYGADGAAELLGMKPSTLASRIKKLGLEKPT